MDTRILFRLSAACPFRPKRDWLLCVARHTAVTLTWNAPLSQAQGPGISVSSIEPSGGWLPRFCLSSSRSLGRCLLLGHRTRMNAGSDHVRTLLHQDRGDPRAQFTRHRHNGDPRSPRARMGPAHRAVKVPQLAVLPNGRPRGLDQFPLNRRSPVWVIEPRSVFSPVDRSLGTTPRNPPSWRTFSSTRQSPIRASS